jgi:hypothetical protein
MKYLVFFFLVLFNSTLAQINSNSTPEEITTIALVALEEERYVEFASLMHPDALIKMRDFANLVLSASEANIELLNLFGAEDVAQFHTMSDTSIVANFIKAVMKNINSKMKIYDLDLKILGSVKEGEDTIHMVTRSKMVAKEFTISTTDISSLKRSSAGWRMLLDEEIEALMTGIRMGIDSKNNLK